MRVSTRDTLLLFIWGANSLAHVPVYIAYWDIVRIVRKCWLAMSGQKFWTRSMSIVMNVELSKRNISFFYLRLYYSGDLQTIIPTTTVLEQYIDQFRTFHCALIVNPESEHRVCPEHTGGPNSWMAAAMFRYMNPTVLYCQCRMAGGMPWSMRTFPFCYQSQHNPQMVWKTSTQP